MRVGVAACVIVLLGGCGSSSQPKPRATATPLVSAARHLTSPDLFAGVDDGELQTLARRMCADDKAGNLAPGKNTVTASDLVRDSGWTWAQAAGLQRVARRILCPSP